MTRSRSTALAAVTTGFEAVALRVRKSVPLKDIGVARENLRSDEPADDDIPGLAETLFAAGQLQPLTVRPGRGKSERPSMALDGRRRLLAFNHLLDQERIPEDFPVDVFEETDPARQAAAVVLTNTALPVHPADVIRAIGRMLKAKLTITAIARALGYEEVEVKRLAALSGLPPEALLALKAGRLTLKQARLLVRLPDREEQAEMAQMALDGHGFQEWQIHERLDDSRITLRDRRCGLVGLERYAAAGGRIESDLFGELPDVLLDPDILTDLWLRRAREVAATLEAEGITVFVTAGVEPEMADDLEPLGETYGRGLDGDQLTAWRAARDAALEASNHVSDAVDLHGDAIAEALAPLLHARIAQDQASVGGRVVTAMVMWPSASTGVAVRCYAPYEPEVEAEPDREPEAPPTPIYRAPEAEAPEPETEGVNHSLHGLRTEVATRGLIRALADDPGAALTALIARLFGQLAVRTYGYATNAALTVTAKAFAPTGGRVIETLDGDVRQRLDARQAAWQASGQTVIAWVHGLAHGEKMALLAELTAISLDLREARTSLIRRSARAEAAELAELCGADITLHWTPDAPFLQPHSKTLLLGMLEAMGEEDVRAGTLRKDELVDWVAEKAAARTWAPASLSWTAPIDDAIDDEDVEPDIEDGSETEDPAADIDDGAGAFEVTATGEAVLDRAVA